MTDRPTRLVQPRGQKRRRPNRDQRESTSEFNIFSDDGITEGTHVAAVESTPVSGSIEVYDSPDTPHRATRSRARDEAAAGQAGNQRPTSMTPQDTITPPAERQPTSPRDPYPLNSQYFRRRNISPIVQRMLGLPPTPSPPRAMTEMVQTEARLQARITVLENESAALRRDNALLGATIAEVNNVPYNDRNAMLFELVTTTSIPRDVLMRLLGNDEFIEQWRITSRPQGSRQSGSQGSRSQGPGSRGHESQGNRREPLRSR